MGTPLSETVIVEESAFAYCGMIEPPGPATGIGMGMGTATGTGAGTGDGGRGTGDGDGMRRHRTPAR